MLTTPMHSDAPALDVSCQLFNCPISLSDLSYVIAINALEAVYVVRQQHMVSDSFPLAVACPGDISLAHHARKGCLAAAQLQSLPLCQHIHQAAGMLNTDLSRQQCHG